MIAAESELVTFDADAALEAALDVGGVLSFVEFTRGDHRVLYADDRVLAWYDGETHLREHYRTVLAHLNLDFMEQDTYERALLPNAGRVRALVTHMERLTLLRVLSANHEGVCVVADPDADVRAIREAVAPYVIGG